MLQRNWLKATISLALCVLMVGLAQPSRAAEESMQALMLRKLFATPLDGWKKVLEDNRNILDTSFFQRVEARIRWSIDNGQVDDALRFALAGDTAGSIVKRKTDYRVQMSQLFRHRGNLTLAADIINNVLVTDPDNSEAKFYQASLMHDNGHLIEAYPIYEELYKKNIHKAECAYRMGLIDVQKQEILEARKHLQEAVKLDPKHDLARIELAKVEKFIDSATFAPPTSAAKNDKNAALPLTLPGESNINTENLMADASFAMSSNEMDKAAEIYGQIIAKDPKYVKAYVNLGAIYFQQGEFDQALRNFTVANKLSPNDYSITRYLGYCYEGLYDASGNQSDLAKASDYYKQSSTLNPGSELIKFDLHRITAKMSAKK
ncbi:MAG: tetratricopeptide repeat protein [bacterium]|nr:tetratricopeptide repeat protein [bacterium]